MGNCCKANKDDYNIEHKIINDDENSQLNNNVEYLEKFKGGVKQFNTGASLEYQSSSLTPGEVLQGFKNNLQNKDLEQISEDIEGVERIKNKDNSDMTNNNDERNKVFLFFVNNLLILYIIFLQKEKFMEAQKKVEANDKLTLKIIESKSLEADTEIQLNCLGIEINGLSNYQHYQKDENYGITRFGVGFAKHNSNSNQHFTSYQKKNIDEISSIVNKSNLNEIDYQLGEEDNIYPRHFDIRYDFLSEAYYVRNYRNSAVFMRIDKKYVRKSVYFYNKIK